MATLHRIQPLKAAEPECYGVHPPEQWQAWLDEGLDRAKSWAPIPRRRLPDVLDISVRIAATFRDADDSVVTHRDVEPWNVLIGARGPLLIDWDTADPDSASLELAEVATALAYRGRTERDPVAVTRTLASHAHHGDRSPEALERRRGSRLSRLGEQLGKSLGWLELGFADPLQVRRRAGNSWRTFPRASAGCAIWTRSLTLS